jgi:hypothetical protein
MGQGLVGVRAIQLVLVAARAATQAMNSRVQLGSAGVSVEAGATDRPAPRWSSASRRCVSARTIISLLWKSIAISLPLVLWAFCAGRARAAMTCVTNAANAQSSRRNLRKNLPWHQQPLGPARPPASVVPATTDTARSSPCECLRWLASHYCKLVSNAFPGEGLTLAPETPGSPRNALRGRSGCRTGPLESA